MKLRFVFPTFLLALVIFAPLSFAAKFRDLKAEFLKQKDSQKTEKFQEVCEKLVKSKDKKAVTLLIDEGLTIVAPSRRNIVQKALFSYKERHAVAIFSKELRSQKSLPAKVALAELLGSFDDKMAALALSKAVLEKAEPVREAALLALGVNPHGKAHIPLIKRQLKDESLRVQAAAAMTLNKLGQSVKGYEQKWNQKGFPNQLFSNKLLIAFDITDPMHEARLSAPMPNKASADGEKGKKEASKRKGKKGTASEKKAKAASALMHVVGELKTLLKSFKKPQEFQLVGFSGSATRFNKKPTLAKPRNVEDAVKWLDKKFRKSRDRDVWRVIRDHQSKELDDVLLVLTGRQNAGLTKDSELAANNIIAAANEQGFRVHTVVIELPYKTKPKNREASARLEEQRDAVTDFAKLISSSTNGHYAKWSLSRFSDEMKPAPKGKDTPSPAEADKGDKKADKGDKKADKGEGKAKKDDSGTKKSGDYSPPEAKGGRYGSGAITQIRRDLKAALKNPEKKRSLQIISALGQIKSAKVAEYVMKEGVFNKSMAFSEASIEALAKNDHPEVTEILVKKLKKTRKTNDQMLLVRSICSESKAMAKLLIPVVPQLDSDPMRVALEKLASRPATELADAKSLFTRKFKGETGLVRHYVDTILGSAKTKVPATFSGGYYLPLKPVADKIAVLVDTHKSVLEVISRDIEKVDPKADKSKKRARKKGKGKTEKPKLVDMTRLDAMISETSKFLATLAKQDGQGKVIAIGESPTRSYGDLITFGEKDLEGVSKWLESRAPTNKRDIFAAVKKALSDTEVQEIYILVTGLPFRSKLSDISELCLEIDSLNRFRQVRIHVTVIFGSADSANLGKIQKAARRDREESIKDFYKAIADRNGGQFQLTNSPPPTPSKDPVPEEKSDKGKADATDGKVKK